MFTNFGSSTPATGDGVPTIAAIDIFPFIPEELKSE